MRLHELDAQERALCLERFASALAAVPEVRLAFAHGSFVEGEPFRDVDVAVLLAGPSLRRGIGRVEDALAHALAGVSLAVDLHPLLDVVPLNDAPPHFRFEVAGRGRLLHEYAAGDALLFWTIACSQLIDYRDWRRAHGADV
jgi:predicted nucleotidyltransferase